MHTGVCNLIYSAAITGTYVRKYIRMYVHETYL